MLSLRYIEPCAELRAYVASFYCVIGSLDPGQPLQDHLLPSPATVRIELKGNWSYRFGAGEPCPFPKVALVGPTSVPMDVRTVGQFSLIGADLTALGLVKLWTTDVSRLANQVMDYTPFVDCASLDETMVLNFAPIQALFRALFAPKLKVALPPQVSASIDLIEHFQQWENNEDYSIEPLVDAMALSERQVERTTTRYFGFAPKLLMRRARFLRAVEMILSNPNADWRDVAGDSYFDQSHFCREFKSFCHLTPTQFFRRHQFLFEAAGVEFRKNRFVEDEGRRVGIGYEFGAPRAPKPARDTRIPATAALTAILPTTVRPRSTLDFVSHLSR